MKISTVLTATAVAAGFSMTGLTQVQTAPLPLLKAPSAQSDVIQIRDGGRWRGGGYRGYRGYGGYRGYRGYGGYRGYFADPDGHVWEMIHAPGFAFTDDGRLILPE